MSIWIAAAVVVAVAAVAVAGISVASAQIAADAQREVAETNARATVQAAKEAAEAQKFSAAQDATARMHESDVAFNTEMEYMKHEKEMVAQEQSMENYYKSTQTEIDTIEIYYSN